MKNLVWISILWLAFTACNKEKKEGECNVSKYTNYNQNGSGNPTYFSYNDKGQLTGIKQTTNPDLTITYYIDSAVLRQGTEKTVYYLNAGGLADSSTTIFTSNNPNGLAFKRYYTYFAEGYLKNEQVIFSQVHNGAVISDTSNTSFTVENGNITSIDYHNGLFYEFKYTDEPARNNRLLHPLVFGELQFLGKTSKNLIKTQIINSFGFTNYTYQMHGNGTVSKMIGSSVLEGPTYREFVYQCD